MIVYDGYVEKEGTAVVEQEREVIGTLTLTIVYDGYIETGGTAV